MKLFADENMARAIVKWLRDLGHDVLYASEVQPGASDTDWLNRATQASGRSAASPPSKPEKGQGHG